MPLLTVATEVQRPVQIHYNDHGSGNPVVLIHGWPLSARAWEPQVAALVNAGHRVITYDRRGFGDSSKPWSGYDYDTFAADLHGLLTQLDVQDATLVGFSMGGGEVARYAANHGTGRVQRAVFAGAVTPCLHQRADNPEGGLDDATIAQFQQGVNTDRVAFLDGFLTQFFSANGRLMVSEAQRQYALWIAAFASPKATLDCIDAFARTDFRADLAHFKKVPTLVLHGDADAIVPFAISGARTQQAIVGSHLGLIKGAPHGFNVSHATEFNQNLLAFLAGSSR